MEHRSVTLFTLKSGSQLPNAHADTHVYMFVYIINYMSAMEVNGHLEMYARACSYFTFILL